MKIQPSTHAQVSPTAKLVAYWRQFTDIPYSKDIASFFHVKEVVQDLFKEDFPIFFPPQTDDPFVAYVQLRYKSIQAELLRQNSKQVLEFASGISLRGLTMTADPTLTYIETDLPGITEEKTPVVEQIMRAHKIAHRDNLFFESVNILNFSEIESVLEKFDPQQPIAIVNEGLLQYLSLEEKQTAAENIYKILSRFGGCWITPDLDSKIQMTADTAGRDPKYQTLVDVISKETDRDLFNNAFEDDAAVLDFFTKIGFTVSVQSQLYPDLELSSITGAPMSNEIAQDLETARLWVMKVAV